MLLLIFEGNIDALLKRPDVLFRLKEIKGVFMAAKKYWITSAHRGFVGETGIRENTMAAYRNAIRKHPDMMEIDARIAADGVLV